MEPNNYFIWSHLRHLQKIFQGYSFVLVTSTVGLCRSHWQTYLRSKGPKTLLFFLKKRVFNFNTIWSPINNNLQSHEAQILCLLWTSWGFSSCWCFRPGASWAGWGKRDDDKGIKSKDFKSLKSTNLCGLLTPRSKSEVTFLLIKRVISHIDFTFANVPDGADQDIYISLTRLDVKSLKISPVPF